MDKVTLKEIKMNKEIKLEVTPYTAYITVNADNKINVTLWKTWEQSDGELNRSITYINIYELSEKGLKEAKDELKKAIK